MAEFKISIGTIQSADCKTLTVSDNSNWNDNDEGYVKGDFIRTFDLIDSNDEVVKSIVLSGTDIASFTQERDSYYKVKLTVENSPILLEDHVTLVLSCFFNRKAATASANTEDCGCDNSDEMNIAVARNKVFSAETMAVYKSGSKSQDLLDHANVIIDELINKKC